MINITKKAENASTKMIELTDGKKSVYITNGRGVINVIMNNASHKAWKGAGKFFYSWDEAMAAYKSAFMKEAIETAKTEIAH